MSGTPIDTEISEGIGTITFNRPDRLNALTREMMVDLRSGLEKMATDDSVRVVCLTGAGRGFCAGQDLSERDPRQLSKPFDLEAIQIELFHPVIRILSTIPKPVVAKVNGIAAGAGAAIAMAADIVVAAHSAKFAFSFVKVGLSVDAGLGQSLVRNLGPARARALLMLGETLDAKTAENIGVIWKAVPDEELTSTVEAILLQLSTAPRTALNGIKQAVLAAQYNNGFDEYLAEEARLQGIAGLHPDYAEGVLSFLDRRKPKFS